MLGTSDFNIGNWEVGRKSRNAKKPGRKKRDTYIGYYHGGGAEEKNCGV